MYSKAFDDYIKKSSFPITETKKFRHLKSVIVSVELLKAIEKVISQSMQNEVYQIKYTRKYKGISDRYYSSVQALEDCDNSLNRTIETLIMDVSAGDDFLLHLVFGKITLGDMDPFFNSYPLPTPFNVYGEITGKKKQIIKLKADIHYQLRRHSHNNIYSFLSNAGVLFTLMLTFVLFRVYHHFFGVPTTYSIPILGIAHRPFDTATFWGRVLPYAQLWLCAVGSAICFREIIKQLFPRLQFIMGDNQEAVQRKRILKKRIIWDVIIAIILNLIFLFIEHWCF